MWRIAAMLQCLVVASILVGCSGNNSKNIGQKVTPSVARSVPTSSGATAKAPIPVTETPASQPVATPMPSATVPPTASPTPPPPTPTPTSPPPTRYPLQGRGAGVSDNLGLAKGFTTFQFNYQGSSNFIAHLLDSQGNELELLVNTIGAYSGKTAYDLPNDGEYVISVQSDGPWTGEVEQPNVDNQPGMSSAQGTGDEVVYLKLDAGLRRLHFTHNGQRNFIVYIYNDVGDRKLLVNEIGSYDGTVPQQIGTGGGIFAIAIRADGVWTVTSQ